MTELERKKRMLKTKVHLLDYPRHSDKPKLYEYNTSEALKEKFAKELNDHDDSVKFRLWVVEDLSREVIETLGAHYDIDPSFFREHIVDYVWYNIRQCYSPRPQLSKRKADQKVQGTGGVILQTWTSFRVAKTGFKCASPEFATSRTNIHSKSAKCRQKSSMLNGVSRLTTTKVNSGTPLRAAISMRSPKKLGLEQSELGRLFGCRSQKRRLK